MSRTIAEAKWMRSLWCEANFAGYDFQEDQVWTSRIPVTLAIDSKPAFDHIRGQTMTIKDKRLAIEMLLVKRDVKKEGVEGQVASYGAHVGGRPNKNGSANGTPTQGPE